MTTTRQHIEDLDVEKWASLTRRAAADAVAAAQRLGIEPRPETVTVATMTEQDLIRHRTRNGPPVARRSLAMQLVEADHLRSVAEEQARVAHQDRLDAEAAASHARAEAKDSARSADAANAGLRAKEAEAVRRDAERAAEKAADQREIQEVRAELDRVRASAAAEVAAAEEKARAAEERAAERIAERTTERAAAEQEAQHLHAEIARIRADAAAEVAAAEERAKAAQERAEQRSTERSTDRAAVEEEVQRVRLELDKVRSDAEAEVAAARGKADGIVAATRTATEADIAKAREAAEADVAAAREAAAAEIALARQESATEVAHWRAHAENMERWARGQVANQLLVIPVPPWGLRNRIGTVENTIDALYQIDFVLEVGLAEDAQGQMAPDAELTRSLTVRVQEQARDLTAELANLPSQYTDAAQVRAATDYAVAAGDAYRAILQRIDTTIERMGSRFHSPDAEIIAAVGEMLASLRAQGLF